MEEVVEEEEKKKGPQLQPPSTRLQPGPSCSGPKWQQRTVATAAFSRVPLHAVLTARHRRKAICQAKL